MYGEEFDRWGCLWCHEIQEIINITAQDFPEEFPWKKLPEELRCERVTPFPVWKVWDFWHARVQMKIRALCFEATGVANSTPCLPIIKLGLDSTNWTMKELGEIADAKRKV